MNLTKCYHQPSYRGYPGLLSSLLADYEQTTSKEEHYSLPATNISTEAKAYKLEVALPGVDKKEVRVDLEDQLLTITAENKADKKESSTHFSKREFGYRSYKRSFTLPEDVNVEKIGADFNNGVLKIEIPRIKEEKVNTRKEISIS